MRGAGGGGEGRVLWAQRSSLPFPPALLLLYDVTNKASFDSIQVRGFLPGGSGGGETGQDGATHAPNPPPVQMASGSQTPEDPPDSGGGGKTAPPGAC